MEEILNEVDIFKTFPEKEQALVGDYKLTLETKNKLEKEAEYRYYLARDFT